MFAHVCVRCCVFAYACACLRMFVNVCIVVHVCVGLRMNVSVRVRVL